MVKQVGKRAFVLLMALCMTVSAGAVSYMPGANADVASASYWQKRETAPDRVLLTPKQIEQVNADIMAASEDTKVVDLLTIPQTMDTTALIETLCGFSIENTYYVNGSAVSSAYYEALRSNMRDPAASTVKQMRYGLICENADIKSLPTADVLSDAADDPEYDEFQINKVLTGDGVIVAAQSRDGKWYYVKTSKVDGWVQADRVAVCSTRQAWLDYLQAKDFLMVTGSKVVLEQSVLNPAISSKILTIGTKLPLSQRAAHFMDGRIPFDNYVVLMPIRNADGSCTFQETPIPLNRDVHVGYLPYTQNNLIAQIFKEQGDRYGWGGMLNADDCTSLVVNAYRCFGIYLPNGRWMQFVPDLVVTDLSGYSDAQKAQVVSELPCGSILQFHGHVMAYLGQTGEEQYVISALGNAMIDGTSTSRIRTVTVSTLHTRRANGNTWLHELYFALSVQVPAFTDVSAAAEKDTILSLARQNIVRGTSETTFSPNAAISKPVAVKMLSRAFFVDTDWLNKTLTGTSSDALNQAILAIWEKQSLGGTPELRSKTEQELTRAQFCVWLNSLMDSAKQPVTE